MNRGSEEFTFCSRLSGGLRTDSFETKFYEKPLKKSVFRCHLSFKKKKKTLNYSPNTNNLSNLKY